MGVELPYTVAPTELAWTATGMVCFIIIAFMWWFWFRKLRDLLNLGKNGRSQLQILEKITLQTLLGLAQLCVALGGAFAMTQPPPTPRIEVTISGIVVAASILLLEVCLALASVSTLLFQKLIFAKSRNWRERSTDPQQTQIVK
jgi:hypothetical protein